MQNSWRLVVAVAVVAIGTLSAGCATVHPWQKGRLANRCMMFDPDSGLVGFTAHWQESREGSSGGYGVQGGGCGCK
jgi:hypothetical protein